VLTLQHLPYLAGAAGIHINEINKYLDVLEEEKKLKLCGRKEVCFILY